MDPGLSILNISDLRIRDLVFHDFNFRISQSLMLTRQSLYISGVDIYIFQDPIVETKYLQNRSVKNSEFLIQHSNIFKFLHIALHKIILSKIQYLFFRLKKLDIQDNNGTRDFELSVLKCQNSKYINIWILNHEIGYAKELILGFPF